MIIKNVGNSSKLASRILFIIGTVFLVIAVCFNIYDSKVKSAWDISNATITNINHTNETIKISYSYNGEVYSETSSFYSSFYQKGDELKIYINPNNPNEYYVSDTIYVAVIFYCIAGLFSLISIVLFVISNNHEKVINDCLNYGYKKTLEVQEIKRSHVYNKGKSYFYLVVKYQGKNYNSDLFTISRSSKSNNKYLVDAYFLENGKYYIKLDSYRENELVDF